MSKSKAHNRTFSHNKQDQVLKTMHQGFNYFHEIDLPNSNYHTTVKRRRIKTSANDQHSVRSMLSHNKQQFVQIRAQLNNLRQVQLNDYIKKSLRYQQLLNINDNKKKRLPTLNAKIGQVVKKSVVEVLNKNIQYSILTVQLKTDGWKPQSRQGHTITVYKNSAVLIGGHCSAPYSTAQVYSFQNNDWYKNFPLPSGRSYHTSVFYKNRFIIVFGGMGSYDISRKCRVCYNTINLIDLQTWSGRNLKMTNQESIEGRRSHGAVLMGKYMLVLGGMNTRRECLQDFVYLDLKELRWYEKQYKIEDRDLGEQMKTGLTKHKMIAHFRSTHKNLPLYSSEYNQQQGVYIFGGNFGNTQENTVLFMGFNKYNPYLKKLQYAGLPPSSVDPIVQRINQNQLVVISGDLGDRNIKLFRIKQREFIGVFKYTNTLFVGGLGSAMAKYDDSLYLFFGLTQNGYVGAIHALTLTEKTVQNETRKKKERTEELQWKREADMDSQDNSFLHI